MLISPPFLVTRGAAQTEDQWIDACMSGGAVGDGAFPVSLNLGWHGGLHLDAPMNGANAEPVRAIADGTVVYVRQPAVKPDDPVPETHAQMYRGQWTDNGVVVVRHDTEIGDGANGKVSFFSITMHLRSIESTVIVNRAVYRKAKLGNAGRIYGTQNKVHFEIICDDSNLEHLMGRTTGDVPLTVDGRTDALYGEMYFHVPAGAQIFAQKPLPNNPTAMTQPPTPRGQRQPAAVALQTVHTTTEALIVGMRYAGGDGAAADQGDAYLTTYQIDGVALGAAVNENEAEYDLYTTATDISKSYPAAGRPAPSAVYEMLRFGRVVGPDALTPITVPHWRQIRYSATAQGWVNLNAANIHKYSDADLPQWKQWRIINDDTNADNRCNSATIKAWLDISGDGQVDPIEATARLSDAAVANKLRKTICKFPTEWETATIDARWGWLKTQSAENPTPITADDLTLLKTHITALCFWQAANLTAAPAPATAGAPAAAVPATPIPTNHWHWQPREFIRHFRKVGWLSANEFAQCFPRRQLHLRGTAFHEVTTAWASVLPTATLWSIPFNKANRRYGVSASKQRLTHYFSHVIPETGYLRLMKEGDNRTGTYLTSKKYWPYYGRGLIQLTWLDTYQKYGNFRNFARTETTGNYVSLGWNPDSIIALNNTTYSATNCADSACFYVASHTSMVRRIDNGIAQTDAVAVSRCVNGNVDIEKLNGLDIRLQSILFLRDVLLDGPAVDLSESMTFAWRRNSQQEPTGRLNAKGDPIKAFFLRSPPWTINVPLDKQRP